MSPPPGTQTILNNATMLTGDITVLNMTNVSVFCIQLTNQCTTDPENCSVHVYLSIDGVNWDEAGELLQAKPGCTAVKCFPGGCQARLANLSYAYNNVTLMAEGH